MTNIKVSPFGVVIEVTIDEVCYYCVIVNDFVKYKTFGNFDIEPRPFLILDVFMNPVSEENVDLYNQMELIIDKMIIEEKEGIDE